MDPGLRNQVPKETSLHLLLGAHNQQPDAKQDQLPCGSTGTSSGNCQKMETCTVRTCHTPGQPPQNHPSGHLGGWATPWSADEMLDGQHQRMDTSAHASIDHKGLLQKRPEKDLCWIIPNVPQSVKGLNWTGISQSCPSTLLAVSQNTPFHYSKLISGTLLWLGTYTDVVATAVIHINFAPFSPPALHNPH